MDYYPYAVWQWLVGSPAGKHLKWGRIGEIAALSLFAWMAMTVIGILLFGFSFIFVIPSAVVAIAWSVWGTSTFLFILSWFILFTV